MTFHLSVLSALIVLSPSAPARAAAHAQTDAVFLVPLAPAPKPENVPELPNGQGLGFRWVLRETELERWTARGGVSSNRPSWVGLGCERCLGNGFGLDLAVRATLLQPWPEASVLVAWYPADGVELSVGLDLASGRLLHGLRLDP
jgi:hypothetical protein